jgi:hypothetical protein
MAEFMRKDGKLLVHLVNYAKKRVPAGAEVLVDGAAGRKGLLCLPGERKEQRAIAAQKGAKGVGKLKLPGFARYALLVLEL